jgi:ribonuclease BN (tRNA processing enzyme)
MTRQHRERGSLLLTFLGSGDAFGSGGRLQTSFHVEADQCSFLIDCGSSALVSMKRLGIDPDGISTIFVSHLHGDHFSGIPFILRETQIISKRSKPLTIAGPSGLEEAIRTTMKVFFPGSWQQALSFDLEFMEMEPLRPYPADGLLATLFPAVHTPGTNPHSVRVETGSKVITYSGDTEWNPHLIEASRKADLFICECFEFERTVKNHLDYQTLLSNRHLLDAGRIVLTHLSDSMLAHLGTLDFPCAEDGMTIAI